MRQANMSLTFNSVLANAQALRGASGKMILMSRGKEFLTYDGKMIFMSHGKMFFISDGKQFFT